MQVNGAATVRLIWNLGGAEGAINVYGAVVTGALTFNQALADALGSAIKSAFTSQLAPHISGGVSLAKVGVRDLRTDNQAEFIDTGAAVVGTGTGDLLPGQVALCVTLRTALAGKSFRGRSYLPGFVEADNQASGTTGATANAAGVAFVQAIDNALKANGLALGVLSRPSERKTLVETTFHADGTQTVRTLSNVTAKTGQVTQVTALESRTSKWETQRRRTNGRTLPPATLFGPVASATLT